MILWILTSLQLTKVITSLMEVAFGLETQYSIVNAADGDGSLGTSWLSKCLNGTFYGQLPHASNTPNGESTTPLD